MLNVGMIVGSTRQNRFADRPVRWLLEGAAARDDLRLEVLDLREYRLPFFDEPAPPIYANGAYSRPEAETWRHCIGQFHCHGRRVQSRSDGDSQERLRQRVS
jgi:NAD(P)H-dependent FMN reductase